MSIQLTPEHEARINELARQTGRNNRATWNVKEPSHRQDDDDKRD